MMTNEGKLLECWIVTCSFCGTSEYACKDNGTNMSNSEARKYLTAGGGWIQREDIWYCGECFEDVPPF